MSRLLIVDDETDLRELMAIVLESVGHEVATARNGADAIALTEHEAFDLLVLDVMMPGITGLEVLCEIRARTTPQPAVLMLSALCSRADVRAGYVAGADDYLAKPYAMTELLERVQILLDERAVLA